MTITRNFKLCLNAGTQNAPYINANQYDEGEEWVFDLYTEGGQKFTPSTGAIIGIKSDGNAILNSGTVNSDGQVVITETQQMTAASGLAVFELLIEGETHGTANFIVNVERRPSDDAEFSDSDLSMLQEAIDAAEVINEILDAGGDPSEIIAENVDAWLDNHPEATTTVQDGAITAPKINNSLWDKLLVSEEASGNPASFEDGADDVPVSSLKVALEPVQLGSGDPSPSNVRPIIAANGKNLLQVTATTQTISGVTFTVENGIITANGTATEALNLFVAQGLSITGGILSGCPSGGSTSTYYMNGRVNGSWNARDTGSGATFTGTLDQVAITIASGYTCNNLVFKPMIRLSSDTDSTYQPYQGIMVDVKGRNLYPIAIGRDTWGNNASGTHSTDSDILTVTVTTASSSGVYDSGTSQFASLTPTLTGTYSYSLSAKASANGDYIIGFYGVGRETKAVTTQWQRFTFTGTFDGTRKPFNIYGTGTAGTIEIKDFMLETGSEAHEYVPYNGVSYPYSLGQSVYGGSVDLATGVLTVTHGIVDLGNLNYGMYSVSQGTIFRASIPSSADVNATIKANAVCTAFKVVAQTARAELTVSANGKNYDFIDSNYSSAESFKTAMTGQTICYELATPQTIQLTPTQVKTLLGYNNISSSGTVDVIYRADIKLYIDKKIGELS